MNAPDATVSPITQVTNLDVWIKHFSQQDTLRFKPIRESASRKSILWGIGLVISLTVTISGIAKLIFAHVNKPVVALAIGAGLILNRIVYLNFRGWRHTLNCERVNPYKAFIKTLKDAEAAMKSSNSEKTTPFLTFAKHAAGNAPLTCQDMLTIWSTFHKIINVNNQNLGEGILRSNWQELVDKLQGPGKVNINVVPFLQNLKRVN